MVKQKYRILVFLYLLIAGQLNAQQFNFESDKKQNTQFNQKIEEALNNNDLKLMKKILDKEPSLVNSSSKMATISVYTGLSGGKIPVLYDAVDRCLNDRCSFEMVELLMKYNPFLYCTYDELTPFYLIIKFISTNKMSSCENAENLFFLFSNQIKFDINQKNKDFPPPLSYLLSTNYNYTAESYNKEYISPVIVKAFIEKGTSVNTRDINSTSILAYAVITAKTDLISYCINKGADVTIINNDNHDALYYAIYNNNYQNVSTILNSNYPLSEKRLETIEAYNCMTFANEEIKTLLFDKLKTGIKTLENMKVLTKLFPEKKLYFISENYKRTNYNLTTDQIPAFVALFTNSLIDKKSLSFENLKGLKKEYIFASDNLKEFVSANNIFPLFVLSNYSITFYQNETQSNNLLKEITEIKGLPTVLHDKLLSEVENAPRNYYNNMFANGGMNELVFLYANFPSKSNEIEKTAFDKYINNASTGSTNYTTTDYYIAIGEERNSVGMVQSNCSAFLSNFKKLEYISVAQSKIQECIINYNILSEKYNLAVGYYNRLLSRYNKALDLIVNNGKTPAYEITKTKTSDEDFFYNIKIENVSSPYYTLKFEIRERSDEYCEYSEFIFSFTDHCSNSMNETIRKVCISQCKIENRDFYHMKNIIDFLEKNINGNWYGRKW